METVSKDRLIAIASTVEQYIENWLSYPDLLVDLLSGDGFGLFFYQRMFLRCCFRFTYFYATFNCRGLLE